MMKWPPAAYRPGKYPPLMIGKTKWAMPLSRPAPKAYHHRKKLVTRSTCAVVEAAA